MFCSKCGKRTKIVKSDFGNYPYMELCICGHKVYTGSKEEHKGMKPVRTTSKNGFQTVYVPDYFDIKELTDKPFNVVMLFAGLCNV